MVPADLAAVPDPQDEAIVLVIEQQTIVVHPGDSAWPIAAHARERDEQLKAAERDLRSKRALITELRKKRDDEEERARQARPDREAIFRIFDTWRVESGRQRCKLTSERYDFVAARFDEGYTEADLLMAAIGIATNPYVIEGETKNDFETAFKSGGQVERYANRAAPERRRELSDRLFEVGS